MSVALRDSAKPGTGRNTSQNQTQLDEFADFEELSRPLDTRRRQLAAELQQKFELLRLCSLVTEKVSSLKTVLAKSHRFAHYDELTELPNRRLLVDRFMQASALANRHRQALALLFFRCE